MAKVSKKTFEDDMFNLFDEQDFVKVEGFINKYGISETDRDGRNLLMNLIIEGKTAFVIKMLSKNKELDLNQHDKNGWGALHFAVSEGNLKIVDALIKNGAEVDIQEENGNTPLWRGMFDTVDETIIIKLLESGANLTKKNKHGVPPKNFLDDSLPKTKKWIKENIKKK
ncbi:MAG TPA: ankyrin repeat domain-containing protein [Bacteroidia bacterium]|nr:ankyrin repeat domain-containing protein [Bacteroidia bacterium]HRG54292.1 ankyrin repeat domain-containing protein [Bacteroidia bacterium]